MVVRPVGGRELMVGADRKAARAGLHMGEEGLRGANTVFRWDSADLSESSRPGDALPCAHRGVCAHGSASAHPDGHSKTAESRGILAFVPASSSSPMCNPLLRPGRRTRCRRRHQRLPQQDLRYDRARGDGALSARHRPCGLVRPAPPGSRRNADPGFPPMGRVRRRAAHGRAAASPFEPISMRITTDLGAEVNRSRREGGGPGTSSLGTRGSAAEPLADTRHDRLVEGVIGVVTGDPGRE